MKIAKLIVDYFYSKGVKHVFILTGGAIAFIAEAVKKNKKMTIIPAYHEQGASIMSEGYNRISEKPSLCMVTSGPGVTNIVTGVACSWYDSKPSIFISGQVRSDEIKSRGNYKNYNTNIFTYPFTRFLPRFSNFIGNYWYKCICLFFRLSRFN